MLVGRYQLLFRLGKGGMGEVWAARQASGVAFGFQKVVALKVFRSLELTSNAALMFLDEAKAASVLQHPCIVPTVDLGRHRDLLFIAMDLVQGPSLTTLLQRLVINRGRVPATLIAYIGIRLASALDYAHNRALYQGQPLNLVHRDVSPHNVLIDVHSGEVRLTDFGVARTSIQDHESRVGTVRGKPSYMAPEQVVGGDIDHRTDLFALGIVLYETSCLKRLFGRTSPIKSMDAVLKHNPKPLPDLVESFPPSLWRIIKRALAKDPQDRWSSASEMLDALSDAARGLAGGASPGHDLVRLVDEHFKPGSFDVEARVSELGVLEALVSEPTSATAETVHGLPQPVAAPTAMLWPYANGTDPLSPEAIEAAQTLYQPSSAGSSPALMAHPLGASPRSVSARSMILHRPLSRSTWPAIFLATAAAMLTAAVAWVSSQGPNRTAVVLPPSVDASTAPDGPRARPKALEREPRVDQRGSPDVDPEPRAQRTEAKAAKEERRRTARRPEASRAAASRQSRAKAIRKVAAQRPPRDQDRAAPKTYEEVHGLLLRVKALDRQLGTAMIVTLAEAGRSNQPTLDRLHQEARDFLRSRGRTD